MPSLVSRVPSAERAGQRGQVLVIVGIFLVVLIGFAALAVDYGSYLIARRNYQNIADSAALTGSVHLSRPIDSTKRDQARAAAWEALQRQLGITPPSPMVDTGVGGYSDAGWTLWVDTPPTAAGAKYPGSSAISGSTSVFVRVERDNPAFLSRIFGINGRRIDAWATAGNAPTRWAVLALCPRNGACPSAVESVTLAGTNTSLRVIDGDLGGNWGLKINSNAPDRLQLPGDSQAYLVDTTCGSFRFQCFIDGPNVSDGSGVAKQVRVLPAPVEDPNYPLPPWIDDTTTVTPGPAVPWRGDSRNDVSIPAGTGVVQNASGLNVGCSPGSPRIGPGRYRDLDIGNNSCVILDPELGLTPGQRPGVFVITRNLNIVGSSFVIGDGVTVFFTGTANAFNPGGGIVLNVGNADITTIPSGAWKYGAWTTKGNTPWSAAVGSPGTTSWATPGTQEVGVAFYVRRNGASITNIFNMSGTTPLLFRGILYGPQDNVSISGGSTQAAVGQIVGWTVRYTGNTTIEQVFDGPSEARSFLLEPRTGQPD